MARKVGSGVAGVLTDLLHILDVNESKVIL
jgi:hypothetical protein